jgi:hypothetical protein
MYSTNFEIQRLRFEIWDEDYQFDDHMGTVEIYMTELINATRRNQILEKSFRGEARLLLHGHITDSIASGEGIGST